MKASLRLGGTAELREQIAEMSDIVKAELALVVHASALGLVSELKATYGRKTGVLADRVVVEPSRGDPLRIKVRNKAPHAHLYEYGTVARFTRRTGAGRGSMPAKPTFVPAAIRWRERMIRETQSALRQMRVPGFTGTPEVRES